MKNSKPQTRTKDAQIKKLTKKGTFKATVTYKGNTYYKKSSKKVKIKIK